MTDWSKRFDIPWLFFKEIFPHKFAIFIVTEPNEGGKKEVNKIKIWMDLKAKSKAIPSCTRARDER